jgi:hypothetical protein
MLRGVYLPLKEKGREHDHEFCYAPVADIITAAMKDLGTSHWQLRN